MEIKLYIFLIFVVGDPLPAGGESTHVLESILLLPEFSAVGHR